MRRVRSLRAPRAVVVGGLAVVLVGGGFTAQATLGGDHKSGDLVANGGFEDGTAYWWASGKAVKETVADAATGKGKVLRVQVPGGSPRQWDHMVGQTGFSLAKGKPYVLKFTARADRPVTIRVTMQHEQAPYTAALDKQVTLGTGKREFVLPFTVREKVDRAALTFQLGGADSRVSVMLDGVSAKKGGKDKPGKPDTPDPAKPAPVKPVPPSPSGPAATPSESAPPEPQPSAPPSDTKPAPPEPSPPAKPTAPVPPPPSDGPAPDLYVDPESNPAEWVARNQGDPRAARIGSAIAAKPIARWFGDWSTDVGADVSAYVGRAAKAGKLPVLVAYNVPGRDCGQYSAGGAASDAAYLDWIGKFAAGIGAKPAVVVLEPDAVAQIGCLPGAKAQDDRLALIRAAVQRLKAAAPAAELYIDAGNAAWIDAATMADRLLKAGVGDAAGFAVNVSNDDTTAASSAYGKQVDQEIRKRGGKPAGFVVDTSRNGNGDRGDWCNPAGRKLGAAPGPGAGGAELVLWLKVPGDSDGTCGIAPGTPAGQFDPDLAIRLIDGT